MKFLHYYCYELKILVLDKRTTCVLSDIKELLNKASCYDLRHKCYGQK